MRRALWILAVLLSHWRRHPLQFATLMIGLIAATALWSGVQALNQQARSSYDRPSKVINITSIDGLRLNPWETYSYHASKSALIYLTKRMAARLVRDHINVTSIAPGAFASDMNKAARDHGDAVAKAIPAKRIGSDEDMAGTAIYLASRAGDYVIGDTITVDGGLVNASLGSSIDG